MHLLDEVDPVSMNGSQNYWLWLRLPCDVRKSSAIRVKMPHSELWICSRRHLSSIYFRVHSSPQSSQPSAVVVVSLLLSFHTTPFFLSAIFSFLNLICHLFLLFLFFLFFLLYFFFLFLPPFPLSHDNPVTTALSDQFSSSRRESSCCDLGIRWFLKRFHLVFLEPSWFPRKKTISL